MLESLKTKELIVLYPSQMEGAAREIASMFPLVKQQVENFFGWSLINRPTVLVARRARTGIRDVKEDLVVGYAVPKRHLIVIYYSKTKANPKNLMVTLKHELCHLIVHEYVAGVSIPRWFDEGISQVLSGVAGEVLVGREPNVSVLSRQVGGYISFRFLRETFPSERRRLLLAYAQSREFIRYLIDEFGKDAILRILNGMKSGIPVEEAIRQATGLTLQELEVKWRRRLEKGDTWLARLSYYLYEILFGIGALLCAYAFVRQIRVRRESRRQDEAEEE